MSVPLVTTVTLNTAWDCDLSVERLLDGRVRHARGIRTLGAMGSGDAFLGGFTRAFLEGRPFSETLRFAAAAALSNCLHARAGTVKPGEVSRFLRKVQVKRIV